MDAERLGQQLRAAREAQDLTLDEVAQVTRIRAKFLTAFETGHYEDLPGVVQARGFLRNYARFLRLDEEATVALFDRALASSTTRPQWKPRGEPTRPVSPAVPLVVEPPPDEGEPQIAHSSVSRGRGRRLAVLVGILAGIVALVVVCVVGAPLVERVLTEQVGQDEPNFLDVLPTVPSVTPSFTFIPSATPLPGQQIAMLGPPITDRVVITAAAMQRTWVRIIADGVVAFEGLVEPGETLRYEAAQTLRLQVSNGAGLDVVFNNLPQGVLGLRGQAVDRTFTPDLALTPTVALPPTATPTPPPLPGLDSGAVTALPVPGGDVSGEATPTPLLPPGVEPPTAAPGVDIQAPPATPTPLIAATPTRTPTPTVTPSVTPTPSPTAILPPRLTSTPTISAQKP